MKFKCVAVSEKSAYIVYFDSQEKMYEIIDTWNNLVGGVTKTNVEKFVGTYRKLLGIPVDATMEEEAEVINKEYGAVAVDNKEFMVLMRKARGVYEQEKKRYPVFPDWVETNYGCECEKVHGVFNFLEEG